MGYPQRIEVLQENISKLGLTSAVLTYSRDVFYYTGTAQPSFFVVFPEKYYLFVRSGLEFALKETSLPKDRVIEERNIHRIFSKLYRHPPLKGKSGAELDGLTVTQFSQIQEALPGYEFEDISFHCFIKDDNGNAVAVGRLHNIDETTAQIRYMAVAPEYQKLGFGRDILRQLENHAKSNNITLIRLHAREGAIGFYERYGYICREPTHILFNTIHHYLMDKSF